MRVEDITKVKAGRGTVLITPLKENDYVFVGGAKVYVDTSFHKERHSITCGRVISVCDQIDESLRTTIEVQPGDVVFFHYLSVMNAIRDKKLLECDGRKYYSVPYESLYVAKRTINLTHGTLSEKRFEIYKEGALEQMEIIVCLNGFLLVTPKKEHIEDNIGGILLPECMLSKEQVSRGVVAYVGSPLSGEPEVVRRGDEIIFRKSSSVALQYDLHASFDGTNKFYRMKRESVLATSRNETSPGTVPLSSSATQS